ncbi:MAG: type IV toxin-antitoxin system AbiEi family antitoxin domain-containing protein [Actinobacteria bacterium]|nr:type IV toxin-antitoxin system AbiEi family antitoxin domain-containing protein [Actinomycetota bacterium]
MVSTRQLEGLGYGRNSVAKAAKAGRLHRVHRGVYVVGYRRLSWRGRCMAAVLASSPSVASHLSAGWLWGLLRYRPDTMHITSRTARRGGRPFVLHQADLPDADRTIYENIPVTSVSRTVLDLAVGRSVREIRKQMQRGDDFKVFDLRDMRELLARSNGHRGKSRVEAALDGIRRDHVFTRSGLEERFLEVVREAGLPEPSMSLFVEGFEIDAYWAERDAVEAGRGTRPEAAWASLARTQGASRGERTQVRDPKASDRGHREAPPRRLRRRAPIK